MTMSLRVMFSVATVSFYTSWLPLHIQSFAQASTALLLFAVSFVFTEPAPKFTALETAVGLMLLAFGFVATRNFEPVKLN